MTDSTKKYFMFSRSLINGLISCGNFSYPFDEAESFANDLNTWYKDTLFCWIEEAPQEKQVIESESVGC